MTDNKHDEIIDFIERRFNKDCDWLTGNCYYFAVILKDRFPEGFIVYDDTQGHFMFNYGSLLYDATGYVGYAAEHNWTAWELLKVYDPLLYQRIVDGCIR